MTEPSTYWSNQQGEVMPACYVESAKIMLQLTRMSLQGMERLIGRDWWRSARLMSLAEFFKAYSQVILSCREVTLRIAEEQRTHAGGKGCQNIID